MMKIIFFITCCLLVACAEKNNVPAGIIPPEKMQPILWDVIRAQELSSEIARKDSSVNEVAETKTLVQKVYKIHNITSSSFDESYSWYTSHPEMMQSIFDSISAQNQRQKDLRMKNGYKPFKAREIKK